MERQFSPRSQWGGEGTGVPFFLKEKADFRFHPVKEEVLEGIRKAAEEEEPHVVGGISDARGGKDEPLPTTTSRLQHRHARRAGSTDRAFPSHSLCRMTLSVSSVPFGPLSASGAIAEDDDATGTTNGLSTGFSAKEAFSQLQELLSMVDPTRPPLHAEVRRCALPPPLASSPQQPLPVKRAAYPALFESSSCLVSGAVGGEAFSTASPPRPLVFRNLSHLQKACQWWSTWCENKAHAYREKIQAIRGGPNKGETLTRFSPSGRGDSTTGDPPTPLSTPPVRGITAALFHHVLSEHLHARPTPVPFHSTTTTTMEHGHQRGASAASMRVTAYTREWRTLSHHLLSQWRHEAREIHRLFQGLKEEEATIKRREVGASGGAKGEETIAGLEEETPGYADGPHEPGIHKSGILPSLSSLPTTMQSPSSIAGAASAAHPLLSPDPSQGPLRTDSQSPWLFALQRRLQRTAAFREAVSCLVQLFPAAVLGRRRTFKERDKPDVASCEDGVPGSVFPSSMTTRGLAWNTTGTGDTQTTESRDRVGQASSPPPARKEGDQKRRGDGQRWEQDVEEGSGDEEEEEDFGILLETSFPFPIHEQAFQRSPGLHTHGNRSNHSVPFHDLSRYLSRLQLLAPLLSEAAQRQDMMQVIRYHGVMEEEEKRANRGEMQRNALEREEGSREPQEGAEEEGVSSVKLLQEWKEVLHEVQRQRIQPSLKQLRENVKSIKERCKELNISGDGI